MSENPKIFQNFKESKETIIKLYEQDTDKLNEKYIIIGFKFTILIIDQRSFFNTNKYKYLLYR